jgi:hypothetical protein
MTLDGKFARLGAQNAPVLQSASARPTECCLSSAAHIQNSNAKAAVFSIFEKKNSSTQWSCTVCTLSNVDRKVCAACGASCPKVPGVVETALSTGHSLLPEPVGVPCVAFSGSFAVSKNTQRVYVFSDPFGVDLIGTFTQSQLDEDDWSCALPSHVHGAVSGFASEFFSLRAIQQRQLSDCVLKLPLSAHVKMLIDAESSRPLSFVRHSTISPFHRNEEKNKGDACGMCGTELTPGCAVAGYFCSGSCKDE